MTMPWKAWRFIPRMLQETVDTFEQVQQPIVKHVPVPQMLQETFHPFERVQQQTVVRRLWYPSRRCRQRRAEYKSWAQF